MTLSGFLGLLFHKIKDVLIPLLVDDPLWDLDCTKFQQWKRRVLIPLLVDDPLWVEKLLYWAELQYSLNPSFSG